MNTFDESMACKPEFFTKVLPEKNVDVYTVKLSNAECFNAKQNLTLGKIG